MENSEIPQKTNISETIKTVVTEKERKKECKLHERDLVVANSKFVGINFDQDYIVNPRNFLSPEQYIQYIQKRDGEISDQILSIIESDEAEEIMEKRRVKETEKTASFDKYLSSFEDRLQHARVHPGGDLSPITPSQAIEIKPDGTFDVAIDPRFVDQIKKLQEKVSDLTLVVQFYDHRRGKEKCSDVPEIPEQVEQYIAICEKIIENTGDNIQLEIGNETNVSRSTDERFNILQHTSHVNSTEYAQFFFEVAKRIKGRIPKVRLSIAGVACFDPTYLREVLTEIERLKTEARIDEKLVDTISFHPYRGKPESGSVEVREGKYVVSETNYEGQYERQMEEMQEIASFFGVKLNVGEINFPFEDPEQGKKLEDAISLTIGKEPGKEIESLIYPGVNVH